MSPISLLDLYLSLEVAQENTPSKLKSYFRKHCHSICLSMVEWKTPNEEDDGVLRIQQLTCQTVVQDGRLLRVIDQALFRSLLPEYTDIPRLQRHVTTLSKGCLSSPVLRISHPSEILAVIIQVGSFLWRTPLDLTSD